MIARIWVTPGIEIERFMIAQFERNIFTSFVPFFSRVNEMIVCFYLENVCYSFKLVVILLELIHLCINNIFTLRRVHFQNKILD